jgi:hypothetical protein
VMAEVRGRTAGVGVGVALGAGLGTTVGAVAGAAWGSRLVRPSEPAWESSSGPSGRRSLPMAELDAAADHLRRSLEQAWSAVGKYGLGVPTPAPRPGLGYSAEVGSATGISRSSGSRRSVRSA